MNETLLDTAFRLDYPPQFSKLFSLFHLILPSIGQAVIPSARRQNQNLRNK